MEEATVGTLRSESIAELAKALSSAQGEIKPPNKSREGKVSGTTKAGKDYDYTYKYADLTDVVAAYRPALSKHGLALTHTLRPESGHLVLTTTVWHTSNEWVASEYPIAAYDKPQAQGSAITYAKRYNVCALLDIVAEDDDDGKQAQDSRPAQAAGVNPDVSAILDLAAELVQIKGGSIEAIIKEGSQFPDDKGKLQFFEDPTDPAILRRPKWLASTRRRMAGELAKLTAAQTPGAAEGAEQLQ